MLNALWHQRFGNGFNPRPFSILDWCSTPCGIKGLGTPDASGNNRTTKNGAQRLVASKVWEHFVLRKAFNWNWSVLNALWHQRFGNFFVFWFLVFGLLCSTPCGIKGLGTLLTDPYTPVHLIVLNALWHQRFGNAKSSISCINTIF